ncbi:MAG: DUF3194 domain-containing protein [Candidatus Bathyarchaeota archaeon]|nr:MAG: DUF3194 domain-containing protein [Candidatus Bathyarchaeota archaeon]
MEEIGLPTLTSEQIEELCEVAERAARRYIRSKTSTKQVSTLNITIDTEGTKPVTVNVDVELDLLPGKKSHDAKKLTEEATQQAFASIEEYLRKIACKSKR